MLRPLRIVLTAAAALVALAPEAWAQRIPSPYAFIERGQSAGVFGAYLATDEGRFGFGPKPTFAVGARYTVEVSGPVGLEGRVAVAPGKRDVVNPARDEGDRVVEEAETSLVLIEARLRLALTGRRTWNGLQPFLFAGGGLGFDAQGAQSEDQLLEERDRFDFGTRFLGSFGGGVNWALGDRVSFHLDGSLLLYQLETPGGFGDPERELGTVPDAEWVSARTVSAGLSIRF